MKNVALFISLMLLSLNIYADNDTSYYLKSIKGVQGTDFLSLERLSQKEKSGSDKSSAGKIYVPVTAIKSFSNKNNECHIWMDDVYLGDGNKEANHFILKKQLCLFVVKEIVSSKKIKLP